MSPYSQQAFLKALPLFLPTPARIGGGWLIKVDLGSNIISFRFRCYVVAMCIILDSVILSAWGWYFINFVPWGCYFISAVLSAWGYVLQVVSLLNKQLNLNLIASYVPSNTKLTLTALPGARIRAEVPKHGWKMADNHGNGAKMRFLSATRSGPQNTCAFPIPVT